MCRSTRLWGLGFGDLKSLEFVMKRMWVEAARGWMAWTVTVGEWATVAEVVVWVVVRTAKVVVEAALVLGFDVGEREFACFYVPDDWLQMMWVEVANVTWNAMGDQKEAQAMVAGDVAWVVVRAVLAVVGVGLRLRSMAVVG